MVRTVAVALLSLSLVACSDDVNENNTARADAADVGNGGDAGQLADADIRDDGGGGDAGSTNGGADGGVDADSMDMDVADAEQADMSSADMGSADSGQDATNADMSSTDMSSTDMSSTDGGSGGYDTTGWNMKRWTKSESASSGTPDSYFFDVDAGSPMSASITGGGSGTWSVNVFGGITNSLYCSGGASCQVMLDPQDTVVIVTAITTDIGGYTLTVDYAGQGPR